MSLSTEQLARLKTLQESLSALTDEYQDVIPLIQSAVKDGNDTTIGMLKDNTYGLAAIKTAISQSGGGDAQESTSQAILAKVNAIVNSHIANGISYDGWVYQNAYSPTSFGDAIANFINLTSIYDESVITIPSVRFCANATRLTSVTLPNTTEIVDRFLEGCTALASLNMPALKKINSSGGGILGELTASTPLKEVSFPELEYITTNVFRIANYLTKISMPKIKECTGTYNFWQLQKLRVLNMHDLKSSSNMQQWSGCVDLIDLELGANFTASVNINTWSPTNALSSSSSSLVDAGETFANNLEKLLYNIRTHIAALLPDRTGETSLTITFSSAVKAAIQADTATSQAFTDKNWTIA